MNKIYLTLAIEFSCRVVKKLYFIIGIIIIFTELTFAQTANLSPTADAFVRNGSYSNINYGSDTSLIVKNSVSNGFTRVSYLKFSLGAINTVNSAKIRLYGLNIDNSSSINVILFGVNDDSWAETGITFDNAPAAALPALTSKGVNNVAGYYEFDVTEFVKSQLTGDKIVSIVLKDTATRDKNIFFNSKENSSNAPQLVVDITPIAQPSFLAPIADAFIRNGIYTDINYGTDTSLVVKSTNSNGFTRLSYLKFSLSSLTTVSSAKIRLYGLNKDNSSTINIALFGVTNDSWTETGITFSNAPAPLAVSLTSTGVNNVAGYYEFDVTNFVKSQLAGDKVVSIVLRDTATRDKNIFFNSKENSQNIPQLVIDSTPVPQPFAIAPSADAFVRNGTFASTNYGSDTSLIVKSSASSGFTRLSYLKFSLGSLNAIRSATVRLYGANKDNTSTLKLPLFGVNDDSWTETGITFNNAPPSSLTSISTANVNNVAGYYEFDVTNFVKAQLSGDKVVSFVLKDTAIKNLNIVFNSKEFGENPPQLIIDTTISNALLFVENLDKFPSNNDFVFSKIQIPWSRDSINYNSNNDSLKVRIHNKGINPLIINNLKLSNDITFKIEKLNTTPYVAGLGLPVTINSGAFLDVTVKFIALDQASRVKVLHETLTIFSNDDNSPLKTVFLHGVWQRAGEGNREPYAQEILGAFGFTTQTGFVHTDPDLGDSTKLKGDEIKPSFFVRANPALPVTAVQMAAYHGCCNTGEKLMWYVKGTTTLNNFVSHIASDGQTLLPRQSASGFAATGSINPTTSFGFKTGFVDLSDASQNPGKKIGMRVWKAYNANGDIIPNSYIIANDYLGSASTNYDYNDNIYFVSNLKPEVGSASFSALQATPSAVDFGDKIIQTNNSLPLSLKSLGQTYPSGPADPVITISSMQITGENSAEFSVGPLPDSTLNPQQSISLTVRFTPLTQGLKMADLLIYYNNALSPLRVPLYGIATTSDSAAVVNYKIKGGSASQIVINGKTWSADTPFAFDNLEPYSNPLLTQIAATDDDALYLSEQSSNGDKKPFRYAIPVSNGKYIVRLHFAEIFWGTAGSGSTGGAGSRVFSARLENQLRLVNYDIVQQVGAASAVIRNFQVTVTDGKIDIDFSASVNRPMVSAVEVYSFNAAGARPALVTAQRKTAMSLVIPNNRSGNTDKVTVYPNPVLGNNINIQFGGKMQGIYTVQLIDIAGRKYNLGKSGLTGAGYTMSLNVSRLALKPGIYFLKINSADNTAQMHKILIDY